MNFKAAAAVILLPCDFLFQIVLEGGVGTEVSRSIAVP